MQDYKKKWLLICLACGIVLGSVWWYMYHAWFFGVVIGLLLGILLYVVFWEL